MATHRTALHWAVHRDQLEVVRLLLAAGACKEVANGRGQLPAQLARSAAVRQALCGDTQCDSVARLEDSANGAAERAADADGAVFVPNYLRNPVFPYVHRAPSPPADRAAPACITAPPSAFTVKVRICGDPFGDFVECVVPERSYACLLSASCAELGVPLDRVVRLRKLPNTLLRSDRDVERLMELQELEVVVRPAGDADGAP